MGNDDPHFLNEFDTDFLRKAGAGGAAATPTHNGSNIATLSYLELRKISFDCTAFSHILDAVNESTYDYTVSTPPWIIADQPARKRTASQSVYLFEQLENHDSN